MGSVNRNTIARYVITHHLRKITYYINASTSVGDKAVQEFCYFFRQDVSISAMIPKDVKF
jgi:hypothetical protein